MSHPLKEPLPDRSNLRCAVASALRCLRMRGEGEGHNWPLAKIHRTFSSEWMLDEADSILLGRALELEAGKR